MAKDKSSKDPMKEIQDLYKKINLQLTGDEEHQWGLDLTNLGATKKKKYVAEAHEYVNRSKSVEEIVKKSSKLFRETLADKVTEYFENIDDDLKGKYNLSEIKDEKKLMSHTSDFLEVLVLHAMEQNYKSLGWDEEEIKNRIDKIKKKDPQARHEIIQGIFGRGSWDQIVRQYMQFLKQSSIDFTDISSLYRNQDIWNNIYGSFENYVNPVRFHKANINNYVENAHQFNDRDTIDAVTSKYEKILPKGVSIKRDDNDNPELGYDELVSTLLQFYQTKSAQAFKPVKHKLEGDLGIDYKEPEPKK